MRRRTVYGAALAVAAALFQLEIGTPLVEANEFCNLCTDFCSGDPLYGGCIVYYARPNVYTPESCPPGQTNNTACPLNKTTTCYTTYKVCDTGFCSHSTSCTDAGGCTVYTYEMTDASPTPVGNTSCTPQS